MLSRKPTAPKPSVGIDGAAGISQLSIEDSDDEGESKTPKLSLEEMRQRAQRDREEKQRRYQEAREKIFGSASNNANTSAEAAAPRPPGSAGGGGGDDSTARKTRGRGSKDGELNRDTKHLDSAASSRSSSMRSRARPTPSTEQTGNKNLYDPYQSPKPPTVGIQRRPAEEADTVQTIQPIRAPKGPDGTGMGGFGFMARGKEAL